MEQKLHLGAGVLSPKCLDKKEENGMDKKVSILTPCYNMEKYIVTFLESILYQDYGRMELILVDDGSTDKTADYIFKYRKKLEDKGIIVKYLKKENGGMASAIAYGLPYVEGDYLTWPDSDDFLMKGSVRKRVEYLEEHPGCGLVRCNGYVYKEENISIPIGVISKLAKETTLEDFVKFQVSWCPGCYMVRMSAFDLVNPNRIVCDSPAGQDIQMLLPIVYKYPCAYLDEYLFGYVVRENSHSHSIKSYEQRMRRLRDFESCVEETLKIIDGDTDVYLEMHRRFIRKSEYRILWEFSNIEEKKKLEKIIAAKGEVDFEIRMMKYLPFCRFTCFLIKSYIFILRRFGHYG